MRYTEAEREELARLGDWLDLAQRTKDPYLIKLAKRWIEEAKDRARDRYEAHAD
jgi:hypothetical protein